MDIEVQGATRTFKAKPANISTLKKHKPFMVRAMSRSQSDAVTEQDYDGTIEMAAMLHECIVRAEPEVTLEMVEDEFDQVTLPEAWSMVMTGSGFVATGKPGE